MTTKRRRAFALGAALALTAACSAKTIRPAGVILVFDSNLKPPQDFDAIHIEIRHGGVDPIYSDDSPVSTLPQTFGVYAGGDPSIPVVIHTVALLHGQARVTLDARTLVPRDRLALLAMYFDAVCQGVYCPSGQTCDGGVCKAEDVDSNGLPDYTPAAGSSPDAGCAAASCTLDAGTSQGGITVIAPPAIVVQAGRDVGVNVSIERRDDKGAVDIDAVGLPDGIKADAFTLADGMKAGTLTLHVAASVKLDAPAKIAITGRDTANARDGSAEVILTVLPADPGRIDTRFGDGGSKSFAISGATVAAIGVTSSQQIVVAGSSTSPTTPTGHQAFVIQLDPNGQPTGSFGSTGVAFVDAPQGSDILGQALAIDSNDHPVVAGVFDPRDGQTKTQLFVARFDLGGNGLDKTFGGDSGGVVTLGVGDANVAGRAVAVQADGQIIVTGTAVRNAGDPADTVLARFSDSGAPDAAYARVVDLGAGGDDFATALVTQAGRTVVGGVTGAAGNRHFLLSGFDGTGNADPTFGSSGLTLIDFASDSVLTSLLAAPSGSSAPSELVAVGSALVSIDGVDTFGAGIAACTADGAQESNRKLSSPYKARLTSAARDGAGRVVTAGVTTDGEVACVVSRFKSSLDALDITFFTQELPLATSDPSTAVCAVTVAADNSILVATTGSNGQIVVTRLLP